MYCFQALLKINKNCYDWIRSILKNVTLVDEKESRIG